MLTHRTVNIIFILLLLILVMANVYSGLSVWIIVAMAAIYLSIQVYGSVVLDAQFFLPVKYKGYSTVKTVAITFDDGPIPGKTEQILDILRASQVKASFFCIGYRMKENTVLTRRIYEEGHLIANHSFWHGKTFDLQTPGKISVELKDTDFIIEQMTGRKPRFFRPPYGVTNPMVASAVRKGNYVTVGWSVRSFDTMIKDSARLMRRVTSGLKAGDILLFHDHGNATIEILPDLLAHISGLGLKIVRVDELLNEKAYV
jgi:peptidoglycan/xylan/chitin deacetylase (PgdA/CDA1 family)